MVFQRQFERAGFDEQAGEADCFDTLDLFAHVLLGLDARDQRRLLQLASQADEFGVGAEYRQTGVGCRNGVRHWVALKSV